jgi:NAD(P)H-dependent FMN reductase
VSPGVIGGFGANHHLRQSLVFLNVPAMQRPEAYIGGADEAVRRRRLDLEPGHARVHDQVPRSVRTVDHAQRRLVGEADLLSKS